MITVEQYAHVFALAQAGAPLSIKEMGILFRRSASQMHRLDRAGRLTPFLIPQAIGPARFSGIKVSRHLQGEAVYQPVFARATSARLHTSHRSKHADPACSPFSRQE